MVNLFDIMRQAQQGQGMANLGRQFGLSPVDAQRAVEAFLPAFSLGLQQSARRPDAFAQVLEMMTSGRYAPFYDGPSFGAAGGQEVVRQIFGNPEVAAGIARQVSAMTGIAAQAAQDMMPAIAGMLMGGMFRFATVEGMTEALHRWADWLKAVNPPPEPPKPAVPARSQAEEIYAAWADFVGAVFGQPRRAVPAVRTDDPWTAMVKAMMGASPTPPAAPPPPPPKPEANPFAMLSQMFEVGREVQAQHLATFRSIMDGFFKAPEGRP